MNKELSFFGCVGAVVLGFAVPLLVLNGALLLLKLLGEQYFVAFLLLLLVVIALERRDLPHCKARP